MQHVMVDLETMGTGSFAAIVSVGAVKFDPAAPVGEIIDSFEVTINLSDAFAYGQVTAGTVEWWMHPDRAEAREVWLNAPKAELFEALDGFANWFGPESLPVWGNGATFDNVILRNAYSQVKLPCPWKFYDDRCLRTLKNIHPLINPVPDNIYMGVPHVALYDAMQQTFQLQAIYRQIATGGNVKQLEPGTYA